MFHEDPLKLQTAKMPEPFAMSAWPKFGAGYEAALLCISARLHLTIKNAPLSINQHICCISLLLHGTSLVPVYMVLNALDGFFLEWPVRAVQAVLDLRKAMASLPFHLLFQSRLFSHLSPSQAASPSANAQR